MLRAALRRLGETAPGRELAWRTGPALSVETPIEFELAWSRRTEIDGYLGWLHEVAGRVEPRDAGTLAFRSWVAPAIGSAHFDELLARAVAARTACLALR